MWEEEENEEEEGVDHEVKEELKTIWGKGELFAKGLGRRLLITPV